MIKAIYRIMGLLLFVPFLISASPKPETDQKNVAKINGSALTEAELKETMQRLIPMSSFHRNLTDEKRAEYREKAFNDLIESELLYQEALKRGIKADGEFIKKNMDDTIKRVGGKKNFKEALKQENLTEALFKKMLERRNLAEKMIGAEVVGKSAVSAEEVKNYYERNRAGFMRPEARTISHILISVSPNATAEEKQHKFERANEVLAKLKEGEDFGLLAWDYSDDPFRVKGGNLGIIHKGRLDPELENVAFGLEKGQTSGAIETIYGFHVMRVEDVNQPEQLSIDDVSQRIERELTDKKQKELREALINDLKSKAKIEILD